MATVKCVVTEGEGAEVGVREVARVDPGVPIVVEGLRRAGARGAALEEREVPTAASGVGVGGRLAAVEGGVGRLTVGVSAVAAEAGGGTGDEVEGGTVSRSVIGRAVVALVMAGRNEIGCSCSPPRPRENERAFVRALVQLRGGG